ncbi:cytochrome-c peroxidase [Bacteroidota bacterium]
MKIFCLKTYTLIFIGLFVFILSCKKETPISDPIPYQATPYQFEIPLHFPTNLNIPEDNPMTVEGVELGRYLFYDERLAGRADEGLYMSCGTCHLQENSFENGSGHGIGIDGGITANVMLPLINLLWNPGTYAWNGSVPSIEDDIMGVVTDPTEFNSTHEKVVNAISNISRYPPKFEKAFGTSEVTMDRIAKALAQFIRTFVTSNSRFDQWMRGETQLTPEELQGFVLFTTEEGADCFHCHGGDGNPLFTTHLFYNNAKDGPSINDPSDRYSVTGIVSDKGAYKATTLRNISKTGPYMHDGRFSTLDEVIDHYSQGLVWSPHVHPLMHKIVDGGAQLIPQEKVSLKAFLLSLTDEEFINNPDLGKPADLNFP